MMKLQIFSLVCLLSLLTLNDTHAQQNESQKHIIKFNLAPIFVGEFMPSYEYVFHKKLSGEIGIGFVTKNYLNDFVQEANLSNSRLLKVGPAFSLALRYYPYRSAELIYCTAEIRYRRYREAYQQLNAEGLTEETIEYNQRVIPRLGLGYIIYMDSHLLIDLSANLGLGIEKKLLLFNESPMSNYYLHFGIGFKLAYTL